MKITDQGSHSVGVIGLGLLGTAICDRLLQSGYSVVGYDIAATACERLARRGGTISRTPQGVPAGCQRIVFSLPDSMVVRRVVDQVRNQLTPGIDILDTTTGGPDETEQLAADLGTKQVRWLDTTVVGSSEQMRRGEAIILVGGTRGGFTDNQDLLETLSRRWFYVGASGNGARMKLVVNLVIGLHRAVLAEGLGLANAFGFDLHETLEILRESAAYSRMMDTKGLKMIQHDFAPQARLAQHLKDVELILAHGGQRGAKLPLSHLHRELLAALNEDGMGDADNSAIIKAFQP